jgi:Domain of unknown function (DUF4279)
MKIRQYAYFGFWSDETTAAQITARLGIEPDGFLVKGSRMTSPPRPRYHKWRLQCDRAETSVEDQINAVLQRLIPKKAEIAALVADLQNEIDPGGGALQVVRHFGDDRGEEEESSEATLADGRELEKLSGQHQLLGWHLGRNVLDFLDDVKADIDFDEYG